MGGHEIGGGVEQNWGKGACATRPRPKIATGHSTSVTDRRTDGSHPTCDNSLTVTKARSAKN